MKKYYWGSLRNDDGDEERQKSNRFRHDKQNNNFARYHAFLYISLPPLHEYNVNVKRPKFTFCRRREQKTTTFHFLFLNFDTVL